MTLLSQGVMADAKAALEDSGLFKKRLAKLPKSKVIMLVNFLGTNYRGMQCNEVICHSTIEGCLQLAIYKAGGIFYKNLDSLGKVSWVRASRTDKGVHSVGSVISLKTQNPFKSLEELRLKINKFLPADIRIITVKKHSNSFNCYQRCISRTYRYICPSKLFSTLSPAQIAEPSNSHRISFEGLSKLSRILVSFTGTHNFRNFTKPSHYAHKNDDTFQRQIERFSVAEVFNVRGEEFLCLEVTGTSFMYHQIRKMVSYAICSFRGNSIGEVPLERLLSKECDRRVPKAPPDGLYLKAAKFVHLRKDVEDTKETPFGLGFANLAKAEEFEAKEVMPKVCERTMEDGVFDAWIECMEVNRTEFK